MLFGSFHAVLSRQYHKRVKVMRYDRPRATVNQRFRLVAFRRSLVLFVACHTHRAENTVVAELISVSGHENTDSQLWQHSLLLLLVFHHPLTLSL